ncbi:MAG: hypothetical protein SFU53_05150 [Terrimicrobiaceae bacterium]|nr:hypothetical protein [Terrimicrobiaceae bacterium]
MKEHPFDRIQTSSAGTGEISSADIERRAKELAQTDGRSVVREHDIVRAMDDLSHPGPPPPPEADETEAPVGSWSSALAGHPHTGVHVQPDDEQSAAQRLVEQGVEEADHDRRVAATENPAE